MDEIEKNMIQMCSTDNLLQVLSFDKYIPSLQELAMTSHLHHPDVQIFWNYFPLSWWFDPITRFVLNLFIWPLWLLQLPVQLVWNFIPDNLIGIAIFFAVIVFLMTLTFLAVALAIMAGILVIILIGVAVAFALLILAYLLFIIYILFI